MKIAQINPNIHKNFNLEKEFQKIYIFNSIFYAGWAFLYHSQLSAMNKSIDQNCLKKKTDAYIAPPPQEELEQ